jgi:hypothetical protein
MARVPVITSPCPFRWRESPVPGKDFCGHCQRHVHNLDLMTMQERETFLSGCTGNVCVSYTVRRAARIPLAMGLSLAVLAGSANACDLPPDSAYSNLADINDITAGGTEAGEKLQWIDPSEASLPNKPDLPDIDAATWLPTPKTGDTST